MDRHFLTIIIFVRNSYVIITVAQAPVDMHLHLHWHTWLDVGLDMFIDTCLDMPAVTVTVQVTSAAHKQLAQAEITHPVSQYLP